MKLTTQQALIYCNISKRNFTKRKLPHSMQKRKKMFTLDVLDNAFPNAPRILPSEEELPLTLEVITEKLDQAKGEDLFHELSLTYFNDNLDLNQESLIQSLTVNVLQRNHVDHLVVSDPSNIDLIKMQSHLLTNYNNLTKAIKNV